MRQCWADLALDGADAVVQPTVAGVVAPRPPRFGGKLAAW
jgi:hypothetical protein